MFILLAQNEPKRAAVHLVRQRRTALRSSQRTGDIGKSHALRRVADPFFICRHTILPTIDILLGGVKWQVHNISFLLALLLYTGPTKSYY
jgi:hypothetical protein